VNVNEPVNTIRTLSARSAALETYALAHDRFSEAEQMYVAEGQMAMASGAHTYALIALRAYRAEIDDQEPEK
jgi:hypothetical protein